MNRKEAAEYVGITVKQLDGYRNRYTVNSINQWSGYGFKYYYRIKDLDKLKVRIQERNAKLSSNRAARTSIAADPIRLILEEMVGRYCY